MPVGSSSTGQAGRSGSHTAAHGMNASSIGIALIDDAARVIARAVAKKNFILDTERKYRNSEKIESDV